MTNGLGGYAYGTLAGPPTRASHGMLVAALEPPVGRAMLVGGLIETASVGGTAFGLSACELSTGEIVLGGSRHIESFALDGMPPVRRFAVGGATIERRVWMAQDRNTTDVRWTVVSAPGPVALRVEPLVTERDHHEPITVDLRRPMAEPLPAAAHSLGNGLVVQMADGGTPILLVACVATGSSAATIDQAAIDAARSPGERDRPWRPGDVAAGRWVRDLRHRAESERGLADVGDLYAAATFGATLEAGGSLHLVLSAEVPERIEALSRRSPPRWSDRRTSSGVPPRAGPTRSWHISSLPRTSSSSSGDPRRTRRTQRRRPNRTAGPSSRATRGSPTGDATP